MSFIDLSEKALVFDYSFNISGLDAEPFLKAWIADPLLSMVTEVKDGGFYLEQ
tara:strand:- start:1509 stop:1667 length:159 start_codon:yes stop_codon:yes gene_type:complete